MMAMALLATFAVTGIARSEVPMEKIAAGERSAIVTARQVVVRTEIEWQQLWTEHASSQPTPEMDFAARMVIAVFLGTRSTSGYGVQIVDVRDRQGALWVKYAESTPSPGAMVMQVLTTPFCMVSVPARDGDVRFEQVPAPLRPYRRSSTGAIAK
jgi:hypothetical protein